MRPHVVVEKDARSGPVNDEERQLWQLGGVECVMVSCCTGAELQIRKDGEIVLRELYPMKSDLYERANDLRIEYGGTTMPRADT
jgi:hypothetical protein